MPYRQENWRIAGQKWTYELSDFRFAILYKQGVENTVADAFSRPAKLHKIWDEGEQVTISQEVVSSILPSPDNNFKECVGSNFKCINFKTGF